MENKKKKKSFVPHVLPSLLTQACIKKNTNASDHILTRHQHHRQPLRTCGISTEEPSQPTVTDTAAPPGWGEPLGHWLWLWRASPRRTNRSRERRKRRPEIRGREQRRLRRQPRAALPPPRPCPPRRGPFLRPPARRGFPPAGVGHSGLPLQAVPPASRIRGRWFQGIMECLTTSFARNVGKDYSFVCSSKLLSENQWIPRRTCCYIYSSTKSSRCHKFTNMAYPMSPIIRKRSRWRSFAASLNLEDGPAPADSTSSSSEQTTDADVTTNGDVPENLLSRKLSSDELRCLLADSERSKLLKRLSEANQYNRFLKRQFQIKDDTVIKFKGELAVLELELQALVGIAEEIANFDVPLGSRKINGKYIQSHLLSRLEAVHDKIMEQIKDVDSLKPREISVYWVGMAETVQIMGSFDGWSQGEAMSMEYSGDYGRFSATLKLRPGRYEIKFLVDGEWRLSPEYPTAGDGMTQNNILVVE